MSDAAKRPEGFYSRYLRLLHERRAAAGPGARFANTELAEKLRGTHLAHRLATLRWRLAAHHFVQHNALRPLTRIVCARRS
jgi:hypothetical protein